MLGKKEPQMSFGDLELDQRLSKEHFLRQIDEKIDWRPLEEPLKALYHPRLGRPSHPPLVLFKALLLQRWYDLSDPGLEEAIRDRLSFLRFLGLSLDDPVPDETVICRFRLALGKTGLVERLFILLEEQLEALGVLIRQGTLIDATLVKSHSRPTTPGRPSPDTDAAWVRQGKKYVFGYKAHVAVDQGSGLVRRLELRPANVPETLVFETILPGDEAAVFADKAYDQRARRAKLARSGDILRHPGPTQQAPPDPAAKTAQPPVGPGATSRRAGLRHLEMALWPGPLALRGSEEKSLSSVAGGPLL